MRRQIGEKADVVGAGDRPVVPVGDPCIEPRLCQSVTESAGAGAKLVVRDRWSRRDAVILRAGPAIGRVSQPVGLDLCIGALRIRTLLGIVGSFVGSGQAQIASTLLVEVRGLLVRHLGVAMSVSRTRPRALDPTNRVLALALSTKQRS
jgi:hypothetical protein